MFIYKIENVKSKLCFISFTLNDYFGEVASAWFGGHDFSMSLFISFYLQLSCNFFLQHFTFYFAPNMLLRK